MRSLTYTRRSASGIWGSPFVVSADASVPTLAGNPQGDIVVGWEVVNGNGTVTLAARYKAANGVFGDAHHPQRELSRRAPTSRLEWQRTAPLRRRTGSRRKVPNRSR